MNTIYYFAKCSLCDGRTGSDVLVLCVYRWIVHFQECDSRDIPLNRTVSAYFLHFEVEYKDQIPTQRYLTSIWPQICGIVNPIKRNLPQFYTPEWIPPRPWHLFLCRTTRIVQPRRRWLLPNRQVSSIQRESIDQQWVANIVLNSFWKSVVHLRFRRRNHEPLPFSNHLRGQVDCCFLHLLNE